MTGRKEESKSGSQKIRSETDIASVPLLSLEGISQRELYLALVVA